MNKFHTFEDLVSERKRLEADLVRQRAYFRSQVIDIRDRLGPLTRALAFFAHFGSNGTSTAGKLLKIGSTLGIDLLVTQKLKKAGWLARLVLPLVMKFTANKTIDAVRK